jgi:methylmalonyl-CoA mutase cobalamin-binding subunit
VVALVGPASERAARAIADSLTGFGFEVVYLGRQGSLKQIAQVVAVERADAVELCVEQRAGVHELRLLLHELVDAGWPGARIVLHRVS